MSRKRQARCSAIPSRRGICHALIMRKRFINVARKRLLSGVFESSHLLGVPVDTNIQIGLPARGTLMEFHQRGEFNNWANGAISQDALDADSS